MHIENNNCLRKGGSIPPHFCHLDSMHSQKQPMDIGVIEMAFDLSSGE